MTHTLANLVFSPHPTSERLLVMRNMLACQLESARTLADFAPFGANMILGVAIHGMLQYSFWEASHALPRDAELLTALDSLDHDLGGLARRFYAETDLSVRWSLAEQIAESTIQLCECIEDDDSSWAL